MKIQGIELTEELIGSKVTYVPRHAGRNAGHKDAEGGHIKSWNDKFVFVAYTSNTAATPPELLVGG